MAAPIQATERRDPLSERNGDGSRSPSERYSEDNDGQESSQGLEAHESHLQQQLGLSSRASGFADLPRTRRPTTSLEERKHIHRYAKHELVYFSQFRSTPKVGFSRAARDICKPVPKRLPPKQNNQFHADAWKEDDVPRAPQAGGKFGRECRNHFSETKEAYPHKSMETIRLGRESPGPFAVDPKHVWRRTNDGRTGKAPNVFRGSTTFGTGPMCHQLNRSAEGPGPAGMAMPRKPKMGGGRFNRNRSLTDFDRKIRAAKDLPGPASHHINTDIHVPGGRFNMSKPKSEIELEIYRAKDIPSPAATSTSRPWGFNGNSRTGGSHALPRGGRIMFQPTAIGRSTLVTRGGQTLIRSLAAEAMDSTPGPGYYSVDF